MEKPSVSTVYSSCALGPARPKECSEDQPRALAKTGDRVI